MVVFSATKRAAVDEMFNELQSREYAVISYEVEAQRSADGIVYRATLVIRAKGNTDEDRYVDLLREKSRHYHRTDRMSRSYSRQKPSGRVIPTTV